MKIVIGFLLVACVFSSSVRVLTDSNFESTLAENPNVIVEFFAPWCGHCKSLAPHWEKAAATLAGENIILASVDATVYGDLAGKFDVKGYPTLKVFKNGQISEYKGGRTEETIVTYARKIFGPPANILTTSEELEAVKTSNKVAIVYFGEASGAGYDAYIAHASTDSDLPYFYATSDALVGENGVGIKLFKQFDEGLAVLSGALTQESIGQFVSSSSVPIVIKFSMESVQDIFGSKIGRVAFLFRSAEDATTLDAEITEVAKAYRGTAVFVTADFGEQRLNQYIGVEPPGPHFIFCEIPQGGALRRFPLEGTVSSESMSALVASYNAGTLKPTLKSDPIPATNPGPVVVIVGKNFNDIVLDETKDVLLEVYAPWCGHCKKLEPTWNDLGKAFATDSNIVIAKMDGTTNEADGLSAQGFPTILFYPAGAKTAAGTAYSGARELSDFKSFITSSRKSAVAHDHSGHAHHDDSEL